LVFAFCVLVVFWVFLVVLKSSGWVNLGYTASKTRAALWACKLPMQYVRKSKKSLGKIADYLKISIVSKFKWHMKIIANYLH
jgi:hypothetical protein